MKNYKQLQIQFTRQQMQLQEKNKELIWDNLKKQKYAKNIVFLLCLIPGGLLLGSMINAIGVSSYIIYGWIAFCFLFRIMPTQTYKNEEDKLKVQKEYNRYFLNLFIQDFLKWKYPNIVCKSERDYTQQYYKDLGFHLPWQNHIIKSRAYPFFKIENCDYCSFHLELQDNIHTDLHVDAYVVDWSSRINGVTLVSYCPESLDISKKELSSLNMDLKDLNSDLDREGALALSTKLPHAYDVLNPNLIGLLDLFTPEEQAGLTLMWAHNKMIIFVTRPSKQSPLDILLEQEFINSENYEQFDRSLELGQNIANFSDYSE